MACIFVTGGGRGIGRAIALEFAEPGATVIIASRTAAQLHNTAEEIRRRGAEPVALTMDVTESRSVHSAFARLQERNTRVDVVVNSAGRWRGAY